MAFVEPRDIPQPADYNPNGGGQSPTDAAEAAASSNTPPAYTRTGKSRPELLKQYRQRIATSKKWRKDEGYDETWSRLIDVYRNKFFDNGGDDEDRISVNISFSTVNTIGPGVSVNYPTISVNASRPEFEEAAEAVGAAVNYWWRHYDWRKETKKCVKDALVIGHGWAKVWWKHASVSRPTTQDEQMQHFAAAQQAAGDAAQQSPELAHMQPTDEEIWGQVPTTTSDVVADQPCVERVSPPDILIDIEATSDTDLGWIAQKIVRPLSEVKADVSYSVAGRNKVQADAGTNPRWRDDGSSPLSGGNRSYSDDVKRVTLWEFYDLRHRFYCVFAENGGTQFLLEPTDLPYPYGHPFVYIGNYDVPDHFYDLGELEVLESLQEELNAVRTDMRNHRKRYQRAYLALRDKFDTGAENVLESDRDGRVIWIDGDEDLTRIVVPLAQTPLDAQMYQYSEQIESDVDLVSGVSEYQRGNTSEVRRTATEASMINDSANARAADKLAQVEVFLQEVARRVVALAQKYMTGDQAVQILGKDGAKEWIPFDNATIQGEFDFTVEAGSTQPQDENFKRQQAMQLVQALQPYIGSTVDPAALVTYVLKEGFGVKNPEQFLVQQAPPNQPSEKLIENMNYKDAPPDIKAQMEQAAGFTPSAAWGQPGAQAAAAGPQDTAPEQGAPAGDQGGGEQLPSGATANAGQNIDPSVLLQLQQQGGLGQGAGQ